MRQTSFGASAARHRAELQRLRTVRFELGPVAALALAARRRALPVRAGRCAQRDERCREVYDIQVQALAQRLSASGVKKLVIGVSGGLDSTHALLVCAQTMDRLGLPRSNILGVTMPGFATSERTLDTGAAADGGDRLRRARASTSGRAATRCSPTSATRTPTAWRSTTSRSRTCRPASARATCSASPTSATRSSSAPATCPSSRSAGAPTASATTCRTTTSTRACPRR